jgi:hypothetical protein
MSDITSAVCKVRFNHRYLRSGAAESSVLSYRIRAAGDDPLKLAVNHRKCAARCLIPEVVVSSLSLPVAALAK